MYGVQTRETFQLAFPRLKPAKFIKRLHRFGAAVDLQQKEVLAHVASSGRMSEVLLPGVTVWVEELSGLKSFCRLWLVETPQGLVCINAQWANRFVAAMLRQDFWFLGQPPLFPLRKYSEIQSEVGFGKHRFDFFLDGVAGPCIVEVKSVTLVKRGIGLFPDAPSLRGRQHLEKLSQLCLQGFRAVVLFVVQREDAAAFSPNGVMDEKFVEAFRNALQAGVEMYAFTSKLNPYYMTVDRLVPLLSDGEHAW